MLDISRRQFITLLVGGAAAWPLTARAQQGERMRRIGVLHSLAAGDTEGQARLTRARWPEHPAPDPNDPLAPTWEAGNAGSMDTSRIGVVRFAGFWKRKATPAKMAANRSLGDIQGSLHETSSAPA
jgi:hypothetical protein